MTGTVETVLSQFSPKRANQRFTLQNHKLLRVSLGPGVLAQRGAMVAYQGQVESDHKGKGMKGMMKLAHGEGMSLMKVQGQGDAQLRRQRGRRGDPHAQRRRAPPATVPNVLAFDDTLTHDIKMVQGAGGMAAGGMFNVFIQGQGQVALMTQGTPVVLGAPGADLRRHQRRRRLVRQPPDGARRARST